MTAEIEAYLANRTDGYIEELIRLCSIPSVSTQPAYAADLARAARFVADRLETAGLQSVAVHPTAGHPVITAELGDDPTLPTVLIYGHYDVQPPEPLEMWQTPPFEPTIRDDRLYARGVSDDKGPMLLPILVTEAFLQVRGKLPVNVKFLIEGEEECGSRNLEAAATALADRLSADIVISADGAMWRPDLLSLNVASRGMLAFDLVVEGAGKDLHSGRHGGCAPNPLAALARVVASLHGEDGRVAVPGFYDGILPPDPAIIRATESADFDPQRYFADIGAPPPRAMPSGAELLTRQWLEPTLELNGITGGYGGDGTKTVIPAKATAKITCRLVAGQTPDGVFAAIERHLEGCRSDRFTLTIHRHGAGSPAFALAPEMPALGVLEDVLAGIHGVRPMRVAMGGSIPIGHIFRRALGIETVFFSFSTGDEDFHAPNEFFRLESFRTGLTAWARALDGMGQRLQPK